MAGKLASQMTERELRNEIRDHARWIKVYARELTLRTRDTYQQEVANLIYRFGESIEKFVMEEV